MMTENLQEMVSGINMQPAKGISSEYDILIGRMDKKEDLPAITQIHFV